MKIVFEELIAATGPNAMVFVEVEDDTGHSKSWGEWGKHKDGIHDTLTITTSAMIEALGTRLLELEDRNALDALLASTSTPRSWQRLSDDERTVLAEYREHRATINAGQSVHLLITHDANQRPHVVRCEDKATIPAGVYYRNGNFYDYLTRHGKGEEFYYKWKGRAGEFPTYADLQRKHDPVTRAIDLG